MQKHKRYCELFKILGNENRLGILRLLKFNESLSVTYLSDELGISIYNTSQHLKLLELNNIVKSDKDGLFRYYQLESRLSVLLRQIIQKL